MYGSAYSSAAALSKALLEWWVSNKRRFPWRETRDPYKVLVSEVLLHRTRAEQVVSIYGQVLVKFPTIRDLSTASPHDLKELLRPLGLHWRTKLLHEMAILLVNKYEAKIPSQKNKLELLPGVGDYIASAVRCFAFGYAEPLLDTNTVRILGRVFGTKVTDTSRRSKLFKELAESVLDRKNSRVFNYALIDLGALTCRPKKPSCNLCPLNQICRFGLDQQ